MSGWTKELESSAAAIAAKLHGPNFWGLASKAVRMHFIEAAQSGLEALLPVSDEVVDQLEAMPHFDCTSFSDLFAAAINHITGAEHD